MGKKVARARMTKIINCKGWDSKANQGLARDNRRSHGQRGFRKIVWGHTSLEQRCSG
jgi:hypothetical protein